MSDIKAFGHELNRVIELQAELDLQIQKALPKQRAELNSRYEELAQQSERLEHAIATRTAQDLTEAAIQLRVLAGLLHCQDDPRQDISPNLAAMKDMLLQSIAKMVEAEAGIDRSAFAGLHYLGPGCP